MEGKSIAYTGFESTVYELVFGGIPGLLAPSHSGTVRTTSLSILVQGTGTAGSYSINGELRSGVNDISNTPVGLYAVNGSRLTLLQTRSASDAGEVDFLVTPKVTTSYELIFAGTSGLLPSHSSTVTITVP